MLCASLLLGGGCRDRAVDPSIAGAWHAEFRDTSGVRAAGTITLERDTSAARLSCAVDTGECPPLFRGRDSIGGRCLSIGGGWRGGHFSGKSYGCRRNRSKWEVAVWSPAWSLGETTPFPVVAAELLPFPELHSKAAATPASANRPLPRRGSGSPQDVF